MNTLKLLILAVIVSGCSKLPAPSLISPTQNNNTQSVSYGIPPDNYQKVLKDYLIKNLKDYKTAKVEFINEPAKSTIDHLGDTYSGFRVCLSINEQRGDYYIGYRNHFFMINNNDVSLHLFDSGLLTIPFEYCVTRDTTKEIFIDDIPEDKQDIMVERMDDVKIVKKEEDPMILGNTYIVCKYADDQETYVFNERNNTFKSVRKLEESSYSVNFNEAYIVATRSNTEISINRVTGNATFLSESMKQGQCELTDKTKF